jgi:hypothetical protein
LREGNLFMYDMKFHFMKFQFKSAMVAFCHVLHEG